VNIVYSSAWTCEASASIWTKLAPNLQKLWVHLYVHMLNVFNLNIFNLLHVSLAS
jgi:hypothetical protein